MKSKHSKRRLFAAILFVLLIASWSKAQSLWDLANQNKNLLKI